MTHDVSVQTNIDATLRRSIRSRKFALNMADLARRQPEEFERQLTSVVEAGASSRIINQIRELVAAELSAQDESDRREANRVTHSGERAGKPTHDELAGRWLAMHTSDTVVVGGAWYRYAGGVWKQTSYVEGEVWRVMAEAKVDGIKPSKSIKTSVMDYIASAIAVPSDRLDADENLINLQNGVLDLNAMKLLPHSPEYHFTSQLPFAYDADALCPRWEQAMDEWMKGDQVAIKHLQEAFGLSLTTDVSHHKAWMLVGDGANGKDTFLNVLRAMAADGHYELDLPALAHNGYGLANLVGKRVITCSEAVGDRAVADDKLKRLISGDAMEVRAIYGRPFVLVPRSHVWWAVNEPPVVQDQSDGFWRRWFVVPFRAKFDDKARDRALGRKLQAEMPGIFNWGMRGLQRLRRRGRLIDVPLFGSATETYREENDVTAAFVDEHCDTGPEFSETPRRLYTQYHEYCESSGHRPKSLPRFGRDLVRLGYERVKSNGVRTYRGLRVRLGAGLMG